MAHAKYKTRSPEWWKHLRKFNKRLYNKRVRRNNSPADGRSQSS